MSGVRWRCDGQFRSVENGYEDECWTRLAQRWKLMTRGESWDGGLDLDGLDAVRARQSKTCISAHPQRLRRQVPRAGGLEATSHESDFANERCDGDAEDLQDGRIAQAR